MVIRSQWNASRIVCTLLCTGLLGASVAGAADWPQWRGANRDGISSESGWVSQWAASGPRRAWSAHVGDGYASVAVVGGRVYTSGNAHSKDTVFCLNAGNGNVIWRYSYACRAGDPSGTRATPAVSGGKVYTL